ncbi:MAG: hypothetical protein ACYTDW_10760 [Planctomycetota bacterium]|jgi:hypothetical protein
MDKGDEKKDYIVFGYKAGIILSFLGILASIIYLFVFVYKNPEPKTITQQITLLALTAQMRLLLLSTGIFVAMSFGFLGFALFLIQAKGDIDVEGSTQDYKLKIARLSPGLFVILCATVIIIVCATFRIEYKISGGSKSTDTNKTSIDPNEPLNAQRSEPNEVI